MKRIGLMGCGMVAHYGHIPTILKTPGLELVALFDPDPERLAAAQEKFCIEGGFTDVDAFLASELDAVTITSPAPCHILNVRDAVRYGKACCARSLWRWTRQNARRWRGWRGRRV